MRMRPSLGALRGWPISLRARGKRGSRALWVSPVNLIAYQKASAPFALWRCGGIKSPCYRCATPKGRSCLYGAARGQGGGLKRNSQ